MSSTRTPRSPFDRDRDSPPPYSQSLEPSSLKPSLPFSRSASSSFTESHVEGSPQEESHEDVLAELKDYDTVILMDDSGSMQGKLWREARKALWDLASTVAEYDGNGFDIHFLNDKNSAIGVKDIYRVKELFDKVIPNGRTPLGKKLEELFLNYINELRKVQSPENNSNILSRTEYSKVKRVNFLVITDGEPTDDPEPVIVRFARTLDEMGLPLSQAGIQFVQIGDSEDATCYLDKLDNTLKDANHVRDIVDTTPYRSGGGALTSDKLVKILLGGINRRVDNKDIKPSMQEFGR